MKKSYLRKFIYQLFKLKKVNNIKNRVIFLRFYQTELMLNRKKITPENYKMMFLDLSDLQNTVQNLNFKLKLKLKIEKYQQFFDQE